MANENFAPWPDLFFDTRFLEPDACREIVAEMKASPADAATVYGRTTSGVVEQNVRQTLRIRPSTSTIDFVTQRFLACRQTLEKRFAITVSTLEDPQFLHYREGDFFVAHQDGNTGMLRLDTELRRISLVLFLSRETQTPEPDAHCGGSFLFSSFRPGEADGHFHAIGRPGTLLAFRSEMTHEVTPVTHGERYSIVSWFR